MTVRTLRHSDIPMLEEMYRASGFEYEFPNLAGPEFEAVHVVADEDGNPLCAVAAKRTIELYLLCVKFEHPATGIAAIRQLHATMTRALKAKGYSDANAFLPPRIEKSFGRRLMRTFGWARNWASYCFHF